MWQPEKRASYQMAEPACNTSLDARVAEIQHLKIARVDEMPNFEVQYLNKTRRSRLKVARFELGDGDLMDGLRGSD